MRRIHLTWNDFFLVAALIYSIVIIVTKWDHYANCRRPLQLYLLLDYVTILAMRTTHLFEQAYNDVDRVKNLLWFLKASLLYPFFLIWTIVGTVWFKDSGSCLPERNQYWTCLIWIIMCYVWIGIYACLRTIIYLGESNTGFGGGVGGVLAPAGLSSREINELPTYPAAQELEDKECSICLESYRLGVKVKELPRCAHVFHVACIDQWLTRKDTCPLCRLLVKGDSTGTQLTRSGNIQSRTGQALIVNEVRRSSQSSIVIEPELEDPTIGDSARGRSQPYEVLETGTFSLSPSSSSSSQTSTDCNYIRGDNVV